MGGDASRNGAELFETEADFSAKIVTFRLVGGDASPPIPPRKSAAEWYYNNVQCAILQTFLAISKASLKFFWLENNKLTYKINEKNCS